MASGVQDTDRGAALLLRRLRDLDRKGAVRITVGVHDDTGAANHPSGGTIAEVAGYLELGTNELAPSGFVRTTIDSQRNRLARELTEAGQKMLDGEAVGNAFGPVANRLTKQMQKRVPVDTGLVRRSIQGRVDGVRVSV